MHTESLTLPLRPVIEVTPAACSEIRRSLDRAVEAFRKWGIEPPPAGWIHEAATWLDTVVAQDSLGHNDDELRRTSAAIALAVDLYHIGTSLGDESNRQVAAELAVVMRGRLLGRGDAAAGKDYLSQFWIGTLLAQSKLKPEIIAYDRDGKPKPDFLISKGKIRFAVEVKHPRSAASARRAVLKAGDQLRTFDGPGIIVIDATECMSVDPWAVTQAATNSREQVRTEVRSLHRSLHDLVKSYRRSGKFSHLSMLMTLTRYWNWTVDDAGKYRREAGLLFHADGMSYVWSNQVTDLTREIQDALLVGVEQLTGNPPAYKYL